MRSDAPLEPQKTAKSRTSITCCQVLTAGTRVPQCALSWIGIPLPIFVRHFFQSHLNVEPGKDVDVVFEDLDVPEQAPSEPVRLRQLMTAPKLLKRPRTKAEEGSCKRHPQQPGNWRSYKLSLHKRTPLAPPLLHIYYLENNNLDGFSCSTGETRAHNLWTWPRVRRS